MSMPAVIGIMVICSIIVGLQVHNWFMPTTEEQDRRHRANLYWMAFCVFVFMIVGVA